MSAPEAPKLCLACARARLAGRPPRACADCVIINTDRLATVRANAAKPLPALKFFGGSASTLFACGSWPGEARILFGQGDE